MEFQAADNLSLGIFSVFALIMFSLVMRAIGRTNQGRKWQILLLVVLGLFSAASASGIVAKSFVPFGPMLFLLIFVFSLTFTFSQSGKHLAEILPLTILIGFQGFRVPLELILHQWSLSGTIPETMTWSGQNWDIAAGAVSILAIPLVKKSLKVALAVNAVGFLLLLNVVRVVVLSSPLPFAWELDRPLLLVAHFPYSLIGPLFVMPAMIGHLVTFRKIFSEMRST